MEDKTLYKATCEQEITKLKKQIETCKKNIDYDKHPFNHPLTQRLLVLKTELSSMFIIRQSYCDHGLLLTNDQDKDCFYQCIECGKIITEKETNTEVIDIKELKINSSINIAPVILYLHEQYLKTYNTNQGFKEYIINNFKNRAIKKMSDDTKRYIDDIVDILISYNEPAVELEKYLFNKETIALGLNKNMTFDVDSFRDLIYQQLDEYHQEKDIKHGK